MAVTAEETGLGCQRHRQTREESRSEKCDGDSLWEHCRTSDEC